MTWYGYCQLVANREATMADSLDRQIQRINGFAQTYCLQIDKIFVENSIDHPKPFTQRPECQKLIASIRQGDTIVTPKLEYVFFSALAALETVEFFKKLNIKLQVLNMSIYGSDVVFSRLFQTIATAFAQGEQARLRDRLRAAKRDQRQHGRYLGGRVPIGYRVGEDGQLVEVSEHKAAIRTMFEMRATGASLRTIAEAVGAMGLKVSHAGVSKILRGQAGQQSRRPTVTARNPG